MDASCNPMGQTPFHYEGWDVTHGPDSIPYEGWDVTHGPDSIPQRRIWGVGTFIEQIALLCC